MNKKIFSIAFGQKFSIAYSSEEQDCEFQLVEDKEKNTLFDYNISIDNNIIDVHTVLRLITNEINNKEYNIEYINDIYFIQYKNSKELRLDTILEKLFIKMKSIVQDSIKIKMKDVFIVFEKDIPNNLKIIMKTVGLFCEINIINIIDLTSSIKYYLEYKKISFPNCFSVFFKKDEFIMLSVFKKRKKIYKAYILEDNYDKNNEKNVIKEDKEDYLILNHKTNENIFQKYLNIINIQMENDIGKQYFDIKEIYLFENLKNIKLLKYICYGTLFSKNYPIILEYQIILKFLDYNEKKNKLSKIILSQIEYSISKSIIKLIIEDIIPYKDCFYKTLDLTMNIEGTFNDDYYNIPITIYFNEVNYFYGLINAFYNNSQEIIFYKTFPEIIFNNQKINYEEKFEEDTLFKRINLINIDANNLQIKGIHQNTIYEMIENYNQNNLIIFDSKLNVISYYDQSITKIIQSKISINRKFEVISIFKISEIMKSNLTIEDINKNYKKEIIKATGYLNDIYIINCIKKDYNLMDEYDIIIFKSYYTVKLFNKIFPFSQNLNVDVKMKSELFQQLFENLESFEQACKIINDKKVESLLYGSACIALLKIAEDKDKIKEVKGQKKLLDLIDFSKDSIYKDAMENNKYFINKLKKNSFLFIYLLQFNSSNSNICIENDENISKNIKVNKISMITLNQLKYDLYKSLPKYGIRLFYNSFDDFATTILNSSITLFNEINIFGKALSINELSIKEDLYYKKRVCLSLILKHERFCHIKKIFNKNETDYLNSPLGYLKFDTNEIKYLVDKFNNKKGEIGESFEKLITNDRRELITSLFKINNINMEKIYNNEIWIKETNNDLINELERITGIKGNNNNKNDNVLPLKDESEPLTKIKKFSLNEENKSNNEVNKSINKNFMDFDEYITINNITMKKEEYESLKRIHNNEDNIIKLTHTFKEDILCSKSIKIWEKRKNRSLNNDNNK